MSFGTESLGTLHEGTCMVCSKPFPRAKTGRPRQVCSERCKKVLHRVIDRPTGVEPGCRVWTRYGRGILIHKNPLTVRVIYWKKGRVWREHNYEEITVLSKPKPLPKWTTERIRPRRFNALSRLFDPTTKTARYDPEKDDRMGRMAGESEYTVRRYTVKRNGKGKKFKDYSRLIEHTLASHFFKS